MASFDSYSAAEEDECVVGFFSPTLQSMVQHSSPLHFSSRKPVIIKRSQQSCAVANNAQSSSFIGAKRISSAAPDGGAFDFGLLPPTHWSSSKLQYHDSPSSSSVGSDDEKEFHKSSSPFISPMVAPVRDPFSGRLVSRPAPLSLSSASSSTFQGSPSFSASSRSLMSTSPSPPRFNSYAAAAVAASLSEPRPSQPLPPVQYRSLRFSVTTYRWQPIDDCFGGVPVVEIRPYNKSDGKRYVYVKIDGLEEMFHKCKATGMPVPKARFMVECCEDSSCLGYLSIKELTAIEKKEMEAAAAAQGGNMDVDAHHHHHHQHHHSGGSGKSSEGEGDDDEGADKEVIELNRSLTLLASEGIVKQLDARGIGRGNPVEEHKLRIVVILLPDPNEAESAEDQVSKGFEVASLPFYRIKRRAKRRRTRKGVSTEKDDGENGDDSPVVKKKHRRNSAVETLEMMQEDMERKSGDNYGQPKPVDTTQPMPLINTTPNGPHFADFFCSVCGPEQSTKLIDASDISYVSASSNEVWARAASKNVRMEISGTASQGELSCRFCRSHIGHSFCNMGSSLGFHTSMNGPVLKFYFVHPSLLSPLMFYRISQHQSPEATSLWNDLYEVLEAEEDAEAPTERQVLHWAEGKVDAGWVGRPLLSDEYPGMSGAYAGVDSVEAIRCVPVQYSTQVAEASLFELLHSLECDTDAAWTCRALLPKHDRQASLFKLRPIAEKFDVRRMVHVLDPRNASSYKISPGEMYRLRMQFFDKIYRRLLL
eukprot:TRINITY_DN5203_c0_g1_i1.p1 TRINITY_DN5203_c0_g1~~TRINITY_DN5203_c0_g1_i1.p1  ORF type:complete len:762 (+),score=179.43 TRINITY_DN5203_c0_g1_i1:228-2513(+)